MEEISAPPLYVSADKLEQMQQITPKSFDSIPPVLHLHLAQTTVYLSPSPSTRLTCFEQLISGKLCNNGANNGANTEDSVDEEQEQDAEVLQASGSLWLTEREVAFLVPKTAAGFRIGYPNIALHAVTRTPPSFLSSSTQNRTSLSENFHGCLYCQLDLSPNAATAEMGADDDEQGEFVEMYISTQDSASLDQLFETLSHCASLQPSGSDQDDGGHPFAGFAPFGTSASGVQLGDDDDDFDDEAFADADGDGDENAQELSETGRRNLAHLESVMQWPDSDEDGDETPSLIHESVTTRKSNSTATAATNTLILSNLPVEFFIPHICSLLLSLLNTYGAMVRWTPLPSVGRAVVVFEDSEGASAAKAGLDRLILPFEGSDVQGVERADDQDEGTMLRAIFGSDTDPAAEPDTLAVPTTDKNFLISPPGSPPVGWEPIEEDPPNRDTLADDLMKALADLRDTGSHIESHQPRVWGEAPTDENKVERTSGGAGTPEVIIAPSTAPALRKFQPAWLRGGKLEEVRDEDEQIDLPGVTVQSFDGDDEQSNNGGVGAGKLYNGFSISSVKATVDSMREPVQMGSDSSVGPGAGSNFGGGDASRKITPTSRPPLNSEEYPSTS
ncbi:uncharacterized protein MEPE_00453 [Melanopsichium pennsylvanicum]|uniref:Uncharacterized protein n=2 Tax=Melanopsichium pennsylvanicum TaxID=63383 RepID=A0AAJ5C2P3_9BASI|nr:calcineurin-binding protein [Melanopsichium pennsylvanicum 4]SNX81748.1 uncharacterized protein MEPE_00453 [Melanopsichium pennsylvanicum]